MDMIEFMFKCGCDGSAFPSHKSFIAGKIFPLSIVNKLLIAHRHKPHSQLKVTKKSVYVRVLFELLSL